MHDLGDHAVVLPKDPQAIYDAVAELLVLRPADFWPPAPA